MKVACENLEVNFGGPSGAGALVRRGGRVENRCKLYV